MRRSRRFVTSVTNLALLVGPATGALAQSCAMCGNSFAPDDPRQRAFSLSILFMMAAPYTLFAVAAACLFLIYRRGAARRRSPVTELPWVRDHSSAREPEEV